MVLDPRDFEQKPDPHIDPKEAGPGLYLKMSFANYITAPGIRHGELGLAADCLARWKHATTQQMEEEADWMAFGQAFHAAVLEPFELDRRFAIAPEIDRRTKDGKAMWQTFTEALGARQILKAAEYAQVLCMANAVKESKVASELLKDFYAELVTIWQDRETGMLCKARLDAYSKPLELIVELKGIRSLHRFRSQIAECSWHRQAAWQIQGCEAVELPVKGHVIVAVEKEPPHLVGVFEIAPEHIAATKESNLAILKRIKAAQDTAHFPGYDTEIQILDLPEWALKNMEANL